MRYYKIAVDGYIAAIGNGDGNTEISEAEYNEILAVIHNRPTAPGGYTYRLKAELTWELAELPPAPSPEDEEAEAEDYEEALGRFGV